MADKNIQITVRNPANTDWDELYPVTKAENVTLDNATSGLTAVNVQEAINEVVEGVETHLAEKATKHWIDVREFGIVADSVTDYTAEIQNLLDNVEPNAVIYFPGAYPNQYIISSKINLSKPVTIIGDGIYRTIIKTNATIVDEAIIEGIFTDQTRISHCKFAGLMFISANRSSSGFNLAYVNNSVFEDIYFYNIKTSLKVKHGWSNYYKNLKNYNVISSLTLMEQNNNVVFEHCSFTGETYCIYADKGMSSVTFNNCDFEGQSSAAGYAIRLAPTSGQRITNFTFDTCYFEGIRGKIIGCGGVDIPSIYGVEFRNCYMFGGYATKFSSDPESSKIALVFGESVQGFKVNNCYIYDWKEMVFYSSTEKQGEVINNTIVSVPALSNLGDDIYSPNVIVKNNSLGKKEYNYSSIPNTGEFNKGDIAYNRNVTIGGYIGWVCVESGNPGIWKGFGKIES